MAVTIFNNPAYKLLILSIHDPLYQKLISYNAEMEKLLTQLQAMSGTNPIEEIEELYGISKPSIDLDKATNKDYVESITDEIRNYTRNVIIITEFMKSLGEWVSSDNLALIREAIDNGISLQDTVLIATPSSYIPLIDRLK